MNSRGAKWWGEVNIVVAGVVCGDYHGAEPTENKIIQIAFPG